MQIKEPVILIIILLIPRSGIVKPCCSLVGGILARGGGGGPYSLTCLAQLSKKLPLEPTHHTETY